MRSQIRLHSDFTEYHIIRLRLNFRIYFSNMFLIRRIKNGCSFIGFGNYLTGFFRKFSWTHLRYSGDCFWTVLQRDKSALQNGKGRSYVFDYRCFNFFAFISICNYNRNRYFIKSRLDFFNKLLA